MIAIRPSADRGYRDHGWLQTRHTFSFADFYDPAHVGFRTLRVLNEDQVAPDAGFGTHGHRDMEIITYVIEGALEHRDSLGEGSVIRRGELQRMSAGTGVTHSELNPSTSQSVHFLQIWIQPNRRSLAPSYEQKSIAVEQRRGQLCLIACADGREGSLTLHQDAALFAGVLGAGQRVVHDLGPDRHAWIQVVRGAVEVNRSHLKQGDGAALSAEARVQVRVPEDGAGAEILLFDLG